MHHVHAWYPQRSEEVVRSLRTAVMGSCEPPYVRLLLSVVVVSTPLMVLEHWKVVSLKEMLEANTLKFEELVTKKINKS